MSGAVSSITVLLIVIFLFKEGLGLFGSSPLGEDIVIIVNKNNPINKVTAEQLKDIFDQKILFWKELGVNTTDSIQLFRMDDLADHYSNEQLGANFEKMPACIEDYVIKHPQVIAFFSKKYIPTGFSGKVIETDKVTALSFLSGKQWFPTATPAAQMGVLPLILGTLWVSFVAILIALPLGLAVSVYMAELADNRIRNIMKPVIELLAGIPSVVYGFFGLVVIVPLVQKTFNISVGETAFSGSVILAIMALPTIITISEDALRTTPRAMKEASLALGATHWQTIVRVIIPYSRSGITAGAILGIGRAIGETMAVLMVTGNAAVIPHSILEPVRTIPATIAAELGETSAGGLHYKSLFALGCILFIMTLIINLIVELFFKTKKMQKR